MKKKGHDCIGRPTKFDVEETPKVARKMLSEGKTFQDLAEALGVSRNTITTWIEEHPTFRAAIAQGKEDALDNVERALLERAIGFQHGSEEIKIYEGNVKRVKTVVQYPPDMNAVKFILTNRRSKEWAERQSVEHAVSTDLRKIIMESLAPPPAPSTPTASPAAEEPLAPPSP